MKTKFKRHLTTVVVAMAIGVGMTAPAWGAHGQVSLPNSFFEIEDPTTVEGANIKNDDGGSWVDWADAPGVVIQSDFDITIGNKTDDSAFGQGTAEDDDPPTVVAGGVPPNKSDLKKFGVVSEDTGSEILVHMFWTRVQEPSGTTNMDFEFNQSDVPSANGVTPVRTAGDLLIQYDLTNGGTFPELYLSKWVTAASATGTAPEECEASNSFPCWGMRVNLDSAGLAVGSINNVAIPTGEAFGLDENGNGLDPVTFGEASVNLTAVVGGAGQCITFGSAYLKSRSSDSFNAAIKDFIPPTSVNISNCANITIIKQDDSEPPVALDGAQFTLYNDDGTTGGVYDGSDTSTSKTCTTLGGQCQIFDILAGDYCVVETVTPAGYDTADPQCITIVADVNQELMFVDPRQPATVNILKLDDDTPPNVLEGAVFTLYNDDGNTAHVWDNEDTSTSKTCDTDASGMCTIDNILPPGDYCVVETTTPPGYDTADPYCLSLVLNETVNLEFVDPRQPATINILKLDDDTPPNVLEGAVFTLYNDDGTTGGVYDGSDTSTGKTCETDASGMCTIDNILPPGDYCVVETTTPTGYDTAPPHCLSLALNQTVDLEFVDPRQPATVNILKLDDDTPPNPLTGAIFTLYNDDGTTGGEFDGSDTSTGKTCETDVNGECTIDNILPPGDYCLVETTNPDPLLYATADPQCISLALNETVNLEFVDPRLRGAIKITKTRKHAGLGGVVPHPGVTFTVSGALMESGPVELITDANGEACLDGLLMSGFISNDGDYVVTETVPEFYVADGDIAKNVRVELESTCGDGDEAEVSFSNTPLSNITVSFESQDKSDGGATKAKISCGLANNPTDTTPNAFDDVSETSIDLLPGTYTCVIVVDP